MSVTFHTGIR